MAPDIARFRTTRPGLIQGAMRKEHWQGSGSGQWHKLKPEAWRMRHAPTDAEQVLWKRLRNRALGVRFRRQHAIERFIADFCCLEAMLVVEVDGQVHDQLQPRDEARDERLDQLGYRVLRFSNDDVLKKTDATVVKMREALTRSLAARAGHNISPLSLGEGLGVRSGSAESRALPFDCAQDGRDALLRKAPQERGPLNSHEAE